MIFSEPFQPGFRTFAPPGKNVGPLTTALQGDPPMTNISIPYQDAIFRPLTGPAIAWHRLCRWLTARREKLDQRLLADHLEQLRQREPYLYADLRLDFDDLPAPRSALLLLPHVVVAEILLKEPR
jgi:hypothetical protein